MDFFNALHQWRALAAQMEEETASVDWGLGREGTKAAVRKTSLAFPGSGRESILLSALLSVKGRR